MVGWAEETAIQIPRLAEPAVIDGDLSDSKDLAFTDGVWSIDRLSQTSWYDPERNRLTLHGDESRLDDDLLATYYAAWDEEYLYLLHARPPLSASASGSAPFRRSGTRYLTCR